MQPQTDVKFDRKTFERVKRTIRNMAVTSRERSKNPGYATGLPDEVGIQLTNRCNLRCKHCFQWNEDGFHNDMESAVQNEEIDFSLVQKIFAETEEVKSNLYLWGGEPLFYREWDALADLLEKDQRWTVLCTNAIDVEKKMDSILKISPNLAMLISLDGFQQENDAVRGKGTYKKVINSIDMLLEQQNKGEYKGEVSVNCVISKDMVGKMYEFLEYFEEKGVNSVYFCFPWYIPHQDSLRMDDYFKENFSWLYNIEDKNVKCSWHSYKYRLDPEVTQPLLEEMKRINERVWKIRVRYQPALELDEVRGFVLGEDMPAQKRCACLAVSNRMNILPDGKVTVCKLFPEFTIGDISKNSVFDVWNSEDFKKAREIVNKGLMPVCSKCVLLYLHGR